MGWREDVAIDNELAREQREIVTCFLLVGEPCSCDDCLAPEPSERMGGPR